MKHFRLLFLLFVLLFSRSLTHAQLQSSNRALGSAAWSSQEKVNSSNTQVSLLTCGPGKESYTLYGHTAIRICNPQNGMDLAVNYGIFSFNQPNFALRFILGKPDYRVEAVPFEDFMDEYREDNRWVKEQVLNLTDSEKQTLLEALSINLRPENKTYRYNIFTANCTTKALDIISQAIHLQDNTQWIEKDTEKQPITYRQEVHHYNLAHPWLTFGADLLLGLKADRKLTKEEAVFLPDHLHDYFQNLDRKIPENDSLKTASFEPLVSSEIMLNNVSKNSLLRETSSIEIMLPNIILCISAILISIISFYGFKKQHFCPLIDAFISLLFGLVGCALFLLIFSEHPTVSLNLQILLFFPLLLLIFPFLKIAIHERSFFVEVAKFKDNKVIKILYLQLYPILLALFLLGGLFQHYTFGLIPLAFSLLYRIFAIRKSA